MTGRYDADVTESLKLSYEEQGLIQIERLREKILNDDSAFREASKKWRRHRLYRFNIFEVVDKHTRQKLDRLLRYTLKTLGHSLNKNLQDLQRINGSSIPRTPSAITDLSIMSPTSSRPGSVMRESPRLRPRTLSNASDIIMPVAEIINISSDEEVEDDEDEDDVRVKVEPTESATGLNQDSNFDGLASGADYMSKYHADSVSDFDMMPATAMDSILVVNRKLMSNYVYDDFGVIHLKPKKYIRYSALSPQRQALFLHIISKILALMKSSIYMTKREMYYKTKEFCRRRKHRPSSQSQNLGSIPTQMDSTQSQTGCNIHRLSQQASQPHDIAKYSPARLELALDDLCCLVGCSRVHLGILSQTKGIVFGNIRFTLENGESFDCLSRNDGINLPTANHPITSIVSDAKFVLVLEKDCVLQKMLKQEATLQFVRNYKVILFTARGYPDINSRAFLNFLWTKLKIPILALTDADPHGLEIVCSYKFGCYSTAYESLYVAVPHIKWLGLLPSDIKNLALPSTKTIPLSNVDKRKLESLLMRPYLKKRSDWIRQLELMKDLGRKAEIESLDADCEYLVQTYLPNKLRYASWL